MNKDRTDQILDRLTDMIDNAQNMPLSSGKIVVNKDEISALISELKIVVDGELKQYREINDRRGKIITEAKKEAEDIIYEAEQEASRIRVTKRINSFGTAFRPDKLSRDEKLALRTANDIYAASLIYTDEMLTEVNDMVAEAYDLMTSQYDRMIRNLEEKATLIAANKAELMNNLKELSKEERYTQILELSQLLSNELYHERNKAREMDKNGGYQMEFNLEDNGDEIDSAFDSVKQAASQEKTEKANNEEVTDKKQVVTEKEKKVSETADKSASKQAKDKYEMPESIMQLAERGKSEMLKRAQAEMRENKKNGKI